MTTAVSNTEQMLFALRPKQERKGFRNKHFSVLDYTQQPKLADAVFFLPRSSIIKKGENKVKCNVSGNEFSCA